MGRRPRLCNTCPIFGSFTFLSLSFRDFGCGRAMLCDGFFREPNRNEARKCFVELTSTGRHLGAPASCRRVLSPSPPRMVALPERHEQHSLLMRFAHPAGCWRQSIEFRMIGMTRERRLSKRRRKPPRSAHGMGSSEGIGCSRRGNTGRRLETRRSL